VVPGADPHGQRARAGRGRRHLEQLAYRLSRGWRENSAPHCEAQSEEAIHLATQRKNGLLRFARNDEIQVRVHDPAD